MRNAVASSIPLTNFAVHFGTGQYQFKTLNLGFGFDYGFATGPAQYLSIAFVRCFRNVHADTAAESASAWTFFELVFFMAHENIVKQMRRE